MADADHGVVRLVALMRVLKLEGVQASKSYSDHTMTGKELPCLGIARDGSVSHVHHGVLDIGMPQPVLHKGDICAGVQEMHRNRVAQRMKTPLGFRNPTTTSFFDTRVT